MPGVGVFVSIHDDDGVYKHWAVFIDGINDKALLHVKGSDGRFRYEPETRDARRSKSLVELVHLCNVDVAKISEIKAVAGQVIVRNESRGWNCQDYVLELLEALEEKGLVGGDVHYFEQKAYLEAQLEGLA
ncbi:hypothetical protein NUU61_002589 [Penicillium alfredii]|uniref:Uncharacterized protein n=1 Tax=Penicillium alfredii TaxID=1506179 RepID=A0A9W9KHE2_9EURO|nr:uncharacterized protein NUU61_002589 [Penicillium alfredii]KAJ5105242.1 hypothetical protein NUU61_002589 [Penicillium alfredii]